MRIVIDLQSCQSGSRHGGIGRYSMNLVQAMARNAGSHDLHIVLSDLMPIGLSDIYKSLDTLIPKNNIHYFQGPGAVADMLPENGFRARAAELIRENYIFSLQPDIVHVTSLFEGLGDDVTTSVGRFCDGATTAVTLYDLIPLVESEKYLTNDILKNHYLRKIDDLRNAGILLSISEYSRLEAIKELDIAPERIINISSAVDQKFKPWKVPNDIASLIKNRYGITRDFLMYTGSFDQRKNHEGLIKAFAALPLEIRKGLQLLIVGNGWDGIYAHLKWVASEVGLTEGDILFAGKVPDSDLLPLYNLCSLFVFPSLREGFGLPVLEAMSCGLPVIGSNSTSIPEVLGTDKALFDPTDIKSISQKIYEAVTDNGFRSYLVEHGLRRAKSFSWDASANRAIAAFEASHDTRKKGYVHRFLAHPSSKLIKAINTLPEICIATDRDLIGISNSIEQVEIVGKDPDNYNKLNSEKIGLISTWGTKCGVAMYSKYITQHEFESYIILAANDNNIITSDQQNIIRCWKPGNDDLDNLLQIIIDKKISKVLIQFNYGFFDFNKLDEFIHKLIMGGRGVSVTLHSTSDPIGYASKELKSLKNALSLCDNVFVHSENDIFNLNKFGLSKNIKFFPQGVYDSIYDPLNLRITKNTFVVASYGFYLPHKGFHELIDAIYLLNQEGVDIHLLMLNAMYDAPISSELIHSAKLKINQLGIENKITIVSDFLSEELTIRMMKNANLIVFPYQKTGESSSAAVRMGLASGIPVAVTPLSIFDDVSDVVFKLPGTSPIELARGIKKVQSEIKTTSEMAKQISIRGLNWKKERNYSVLGSRLINLLQGNFRYSGSDDRLKTHVGRRDGLRLCTTGVAGCLMYGPYIGLDVGCYRVVIHGLLHNRTPTKAKVEVVTDHGKYILAESVIEFAENDCPLVSMKIVLTVPCTDLEVRVWVNDDISLSINTMEIEPWQNDQYSNNVLTENAVIRDDPRSENKLDASVGDENFIILESNNITFANRLFPEVNENEFASTKTMPIDMLSHTTESSDGETLLKSVPISLNVQHQLQPKFKERNSAKTKRKNRR